MTKSVSFCCHTFFCDPPSGSTVATAATSACGGGNELALPGLGRRRAAGHARPAGTPTRGVCDWPQTKQRRAQKDKTLMVHFRQNFG